MRDVVRAYIEKYRLLTENRPVLVGVSGGADSIALLTILVESGYSCIAAHCNFHLRGDESLRDEQFVREYARKLDVPFLMTDFDTRKYAADRHLSIEMAARELRYGWFEEQRAATGAQAVAVAHHRDDSVETLLMNLVRGTGIRGMSGIRPRNGFVVRPLLAVSREDILEWLAGRGLTYVHVVEEARNAVVEQGDRLSIAALMRYPSPDAILYELLKTYGFTRPVAEDVYLSLTKESGKTFFSSTHRLIKDRDYLLLSPLVKEEVREYTLTGGEKVWSGPVELSFEKIVIKEDFHIRKDKNIAYFDYDKLTFPLTLRTWKEGDWFIPFGMKGRKKLSDYFSDHKFSRLDKERTWLLCSGGAVIWIVGERSDNRFCLDKTTKSVLVVNFFPTKSESN